jgi:hypothetical protein
VRVVPELPEAAESALDELKVLNSSPVVLAGTYCRYIRFDAPLPMPLADSSAWSPEESPAATIVQPDVVP